MANGFDEQEAAKYNFSHPSYALFVHNVFGSFRARWTSLEPTYKHPASWLDLARRYGEVSVSDLGLVFCLALFWTILRHLMTSFAFKPMVAVSNLRTKESLKVPESAWKLIFYISTWSYSIYILFFSKYNFFFEPASTFTNWKPHAEVPGAIYIAYAVQFSFYVHSVHATLFVDMWRKDSVMMLLHHVVTMLLIGFSYVFRYTSVGILVLFFHDVTDIVLESTKLAVYYKTKGGKWYVVCDTLSTIGFLLFGASWFVFRLYWFPLKAIYASGYISFHVAADVVFYHFFNTLLLVLLAMDVYWFKFIVTMAYKVVTGQMREVDDTREYHRDVDKLRHNHHHHHANSNGVVKTKGE